MPKSKYKYATKHLAEIIAQRRKALGLTQADLSKAVGLSRPSIANIEAAKQDVNWPQLVKLMYALDLKSIARPVMKTKTVTIEVPAFD